MTEAKQSIPSECQTGVQKFVGERWAQNAKCLFSLLNNLAKENCVLKLRQKIYIVKHKLKLAQFCLSYQKAGVPSHITRKIFHKMFIIILSGS